MSLKSQVRKEVLNQLDKFNNSVSVQHEVHPEINFDYNSILLVIGQTGSGKTFNVQNELVALSHIKHDFVQIVYVTNNSNDLTVMKMKELINMPIDFISYDESEEYITELRQYIQAYDEIKEKHLENEITDECREDILDHLHLTNFTKKNIYTIIIYDDAMNVFKKPTSKEFKMLFEYRHFKTTYILMMQSMKGVATEIKAQLGGVWMFGGFNRQQFSYNFSQIPFPIEKEALWNIYRRMPRRDYLYVHTTSDGTNLYLINNDGEKFLITDKEPDVFH